MSGRDAASKEMAIRKRIQAIFNQLPDAFPSLRAYNDYLENVEDIVFRLVEGIDVQVTESEVRAYEAAHREQIATAKAKRAEQRAAELRAAALPPKAGETSVRQLIQQQALNHQQQLDDFSQPSAAGADAAAFAALPRPMGLQPTPLGGHGHGEGSVLDANLSPQERAIRAVRGQKAGGWTDEIVRRRAIEEALGSLWVN